MSAGGGNGARTFTRGIGGWSIDLLWVAARAARSSSKSEVQISGPARRFRLLAAKPKTLHARRGR